MNRLKKAKDFTALPTAVEWYESVSCVAGPKFITGLRGIGKGIWLDRIAEHLKGRGVSEKHLLTIDTADPKWRLFATGEDLVDFVRKSLPSSGKSYVLIREAAALRDAAVVIGAIAATPNLDIIATSSSRRLLTDGLGKYLSGKRAHIELLPPARRRTESVIAARARWNEMFLCDVLAPSRIIDTFLVNRTAEWLSDHLGEPTSLRIISKAISPTKRVLSPHTIEAYLAALEDAHLIEKSMRYDLSSGSVSARNYKYYFTDPELRLAHFGPAPDSEQRRMAQNRVWLDLRRTHEHVYCTDDDKVDFVTSDGGTYARWRINADSAAEEIR